MNKIYQVYLGDGDYGLYFVSAKNYKIARKNIKREYTIKALKGGEIIWVETEDNCFKVKGKGYVYIEALFLFENISWGWLIKHLKYRDRYEKIKEETEND